MLTFSGKYPFIFVHFSLKKRHKMLSLLMQRLTEEDGPQRSFLYCESHLIKIREMSRASRRSRKQK